MTPISPTEPDEYKFSNDELFAMIQIAIEVYNLFKKLEGIDSTLVRDPWSQMMKMSVVAYQHSDGGSGNA